MTATPRLSAATSVLLVVDVQDKLLAKIPDQAAFVRNVAFMMDAARLTGVPVLATEQYPRGLGPTTPEIARRLNNDPVAKTAFSCCGAAGLLADLRKLNRPTVVLAGMEMHVCVLQTALDLLEAGFAVVLPIDALAARFRIDYDTALRRLERAGCLPATVESVGFEWLGDSTHPQFKPFSQLVIERTKELP